MTICAMFSISSFLCLALLFINAFFTKVLSFLRFSRPRNSTPVVDVELGGAPATVMTPGHGSVIETRSATSPASNPAPNCSPSETSKRYSILVIEAPEPPNSSSEHSDSHASTESSTKGPSTEEPSLESAATSVTPTLPYGTDDYKVVVSKDEELLSSRRETPSNDSSPAPNSALSGMLESRNMQTPELDTEDSAGPTFSVTISYDEDSSDDEDDLEVPSHRSLKLALDDMWCHKVLHTIKEVDEENTEEGAYTSVSGASPTIVVQSPSFGSSLSRAQSATNRLAALLKLLEGELAESRTSISMDSLVSSSKPEVDTSTSSDDIDYDWYSKTADKYHIPPSKMCDGEESWKLLSDDPFKKSL